MPFHFPSGLAQQFENECRKAYEQGLEEGRAAGKAEGYQEGYQAAWREMTRLSSQKAGEAPDLTAQTAPPQVPDTSKRRPRGITDNAVRQILDEHRRIGISPSGLARIAQQRDPGVNLASIRNVLRRMRGYGEARKEGRLYFPGAEPAKEDVLPLAAE